jgi:cytochrome c-type biogenesis protein
VISAIVGVIHSAFSQPSIAAYAAATLWGFLSVLLSPCHLGAIPLIVAYVNEGRRPDRGRAFRFSLLFALGLLVMLAVIGCITSVAGRLLGDVGTIATGITGVFLIFCGLWLMDIPPFSKITIAHTMKSEHRGSLGALFLGLVYGIVLGPCSFAFLAPMLGLVFSAGRSEIRFGIFLMILYAVGHTLAIIAAGTFGDYISGLLKKKGTGAAASWFKRACGAAVVLAGIYQFV